MALRNTLKTAVLLGAIGGLFVLLGTMLGGVGGALIGMMIAFAITGGSYWFSDRLAVRAAHATEVSAAQAPELHAMVDDLAGRAGLPKPKVYISPSPQPNAFATAAQLARVLHDTPVVADASVVVSSAVLLNPGGTAPPVFAIPGPPSHDLDRYLAFRRIQSEAIRAYQPEPLPIAGTLIRVGDNPIEGQVEPLFDGLRVVEVGGDHDSMLMHPHVSAFAALLGAEGKSGHPDGNFCSAQR